MRIGNKIKSYGADFRIMLTGAIISGGSGRGTIESGYRLYSALKKRNINVWKADAPHFYRMFYGLTDVFSGEKTLYHYMDPSAAWTRFVSAANRGITTVNDLDFLELSSYRELFKHYSDKVSTIILRPEEGPFGAFLRIPMILGLIESIARRDHFIFPSDASMREFAKKFTVDTNRCHLIPPIISGEFRRLNRKTNGKTIVGHISSNARSKNVSTLISAFRKLKSHGTELHLGGVQIPHNTGMDNRIKLLGFVPQKKLVSVYNSFDVFVFPSKWEGFGMPIMEAKRCGIPVITYKRARLPEMVKRNTIQFEDEKDLTRILEKQEWKKINLDRAYRDTLACGEEEVTAATLKAYKSAIDRD